MWLAPLWVVIPSKVINDKQHLCHLLRMNLCRDYIQIFNRKITKKMKKI